MMDVTRVARNLRERAQTLGAANALLWGVVRIRVEWEAGHWRLALAQDVHWEGERRYVPALGQWLFVIELEWDDPPSAPQLGYIAKLQVMIGEVLDRWQRTGRRPPHPPSTIAAMWLVKGLECDWETGEFREVKR